MNAIKKRLKSKTYWLGLLLIILPLLDPLIGTITGLHPITGAILGILVALLREVTRVPIDQK